MRLILPENIDSFLARYASRAVGAPRSLLGMLVVSAIALTLLVSALELNWIISFWSGLSAAASGLGIAAATLILYWALARGPVSVVAPVCASWPAFNLLFEIIAGGRPTPLQWAAAGSIFVGVVCVARASESFAENPQYSRDSLRLTIGSCVLVAFVFALSFVGLWEVVPAIDAPDPSTFTYSYICQVGVDDCQQAVVHVRLYKFPELGNDNLDRGLHVPVENLLHIEVCEYSELALGRLKLPRKGWDVDIR